MKAFSSVILPLILGSALCFVAHSQAATKKKTTDKVPTTNVDTKPPVNTNETWSPKTNRQPAPTQTPVTTQTPVMTKTPDPKKNVTPLKAVVLGDKLKSKIVSNPQPKLPDEARKAKVSGPVKVELTVDENGNVTSAKAVSGNPLLRKAAEDTARTARFTPTKLKGQPVKVTGVIQYNFVLQ